MQAAFLATLGLGALVLVVEGGQGELNLADGGRLAVDLDKAVDLHPPVGGETHLAQQVGPEGHFA